jgi:hypothetical protein
VVWAAAAALAVLRVEPMPARFDVAAARSSGAAKRNDVSHLLVPEACLIRRGYRPVVID